MAFTPQFLDELRARVGFADIVAQRVKLTRRGREHVGLCPFHKEKSPSFTLNEDKGFYHCFGCGEHGSAFDFVMKTEGLSFPEAVERLAQAAGMTVPADSPEERDRSRRQQGLFEIMAAAAAQYEKLLRLPEGKEALEYLRGRGVDDEAIARFNLGYAAGGRGALRTALERQGVSEDQMVAAGLLIRPDDPSREPYDRFRNRVIFPITDRRGRIIAFGGRVMGEGEPKYLNSPETPLFHKGHVLYGMALAQAKARETGRIIVTEGYMDVIALHRAGFENTVAPLGTALTEEHLRELWRAAPEPVLCFDGDTAGGRAAARAAERALPVIKAGFSLSFATMPAGQDPDSLIRRDGAAAMARVLDSASSFSDVLWQMESGGQSLNKPEVRAALQKRLDEHTGRITDPAIQSHFRQAFRDRLWQRRQDTTKKRGSGPSLAPSLGLEAAIGEATRIDRTRRREQILLALLLNHPALSDEWMERLGTMAFSAPDLDKLRQEALKTLSVDGGLDSVALQDHLRQRGFADTLGSVLSEEVYVHADFARPGAQPERARQGWEETFGGFQQENLQSDIREAAQRLAENPTDEAFRKLQALKQMEHEADKEAERRDAALERAGFG